MHQKYLPSFAKRNGRITNSQKKNLELFKESKDEDEEELENAINLLTMEVNLSSFLLFDI